MLALKPACKDYLWGGAALKEKYGKAFPGAVLAETWELSCHPDGPSVISGGDFDGYTLAAYIAEAGRDVLGTNCARFGDFPLLVKFIDAKQNLSIQVHPDDEYAQRHEGQFGKTEMWYIVDAAPGAFIYYGFEKPVSREEFRRRITDNTLPEALHRVDVKKGDVFFLPPGTIHALGAGAMVAEVQQNSNVTYRVYDYGRRDAQGRERELHVDKALDVTRREPAAQIAPPGGHIAESAYFIVDYLDFSGTREYDVDEGSFAHLLALEGGGKLRCGGEEMAFAPGGSVFIPAGSGKLRMESGGCELLVSRVPAR